MSNILITGSRNIICLDVIRNLRKNGNTIYTLETTDLILCKYSNCVKKYFYTKSVRFHEAEYIDYVLSLVKMYGIDVLLPFGEECFYLARNRGRISKECPDLLVYCEDIAKLEVLHNKLTFYNLIKGLGIATPNTLQVFSVGEVEHYIKNNGRKVVLKPIYSRFASKLVIVDENNLHLIKNVDFDNDEWIMQDYIDGKLLLMHYLNI